MTAVATDARPITFNIRHDDNGLIKICRKWFGKLEKGSISGLKLYKTERNLQEFVQNQTNSHAWLRQIFLKSGKLLKILMPVTQRIRSVKWVFLFAIKQIICFPICFVFFRCHWYRLLGSSTLYTCPSQATCWPLYVRVQRRGSRTKVSQCGRKLPRHKQMVVSSDQS